jgi:hypothetical protein
VRRRAVNAASCGWPATCWRSRGER